MKRFTCLIMLVHAIAACERPPYDDGPSYARCPFCQSFVNSSTRGCGYFNVSLCCPWQPSEIAYGHWRCFYDALKRYNQRVYEAELQVKLRAPSFSSDYSCAPQSPADIGEFDKPVPAQITDFAQIEHRLFFTDSGELKLDLSGLGITAIDGDVFIQLSKLKTPLRQLDLSGNHLTIIAPEITRLNASNLVLCLANNPVIKHENYCRFIALVREGCPGWIIMDDTPEVNIPQ